MRAATARAVEEFRETGVVKVAGAFDRQTCAACVEAIESELRARGVEPDLPATWTRPVVRFFTPEGFAFARAATSPALGSLYDALLGPGNWIKRNAVGGTVPVRFPGETDPGDAGWHVDGSYDVDGRYFVNVHSRVRALLTLFLFTDVTERDAPTEIIIGSHRDIAPVLEPWGDAGLHFADVVARAPEALFARPTALAMGNAGDVYVCHPFVVHRATWPHRGTRPRIIAQPEVGHEKPFGLVPGRPRSVVEAMILESLGPQGSALP